MQAAMLSAMVTSVFPLGYEVDLSSIPGKGTNAPRFDLYFRVSSVAGGVFDAGKIECGRECGGVAVCSLLFASAGANGWAVSRPGNPAGDSKFVIYGSKAGDAVFRIGIHCPYDVPIRLVHKQAGVRK